MASYSTPGVYVEEVPVFPPSIAPVATAVPAFIGYTERAADRQGEDLTRTAKRVTSLLEYEGYYGKAPDQPLEIEVVKRQTAGGRLLGVAVTWEKKPTTPQRYLYYSMQLYFANGGGPCYVYSLGALAPDANATKAHFTGAITALEAVDEPTLLVFPDAVALSNVDYGEVVAAALASCVKTQDRFTIADVRNAMPMANGTTTNTEVTDNFRARVTPTEVDVLKYGAAYFPYLSTSIPFSTNDEQVTLKAFSTVTVADDKPEPAPVADAAAAGKKLAGLDLKKTETAVYAAIRSAIDEAYVTLPPSAAIAGVYARVDRSRGVWKAPANTGLNLVIGPAVEITDDLQDQLNIDVNSGKSVNAIRSFFGRGTLVWGARTLAGNDNEWRYVSVRRFAIFVEESLRRAISVFVFGVNNANTWVQVRTMIENFLINQWRDGALMGAKPDDAFRVFVGLGQTMTSQDVLNGYMIVEVHLAIVRPAEFIVLRFMQKMPEA